MRGSPPATKDSSMRSSSSSLRFTWHYGGGRRLDASRGKIFVGAQGDGWEITSRLPKSSSGSSTSPKYPSKILKKLGLTEFVPPTRRRTAGCIHETGASVGSDCELILGES